MLGHFLPIIAYLTLQLFLPVSDLCALLSSAGGRGSISAISLTNFAEFVMDMFRWFDDTGS